MMSRVVGSYIKNTPLSQTRKNLRKLRSKLQDLNSQYPETQRFLYKRGLSHVSQLDRKGMKELREYLEGLYKGSLH